ncbi:hypothetical protein BHE97_06990 [Aeromicrobium sp. PE09-221]|nr:hypothetical protein BHE97_06990 [Aeromicrobium sp. PE09-221]
MKRLVAKAIDALWMQGVVGADMPGRVACGAPLRLPHGGRNVVLHPNVTIGASVTIYHGVTLGVYGPDPSHVPTVDDGAYLGTGAAVIGRVHVGKGAKVGANATVTKDLPAGHTAVSAPIQLRVPKGTATAS